MAAIHDAVWKVPTMDGGMKKVLLDETYYIWYPPVSKEEKAELLQEAMSQFTKGELIRINGMKDHYSKPGNNGKAQDFWNMLESFRKAGKDSFGLFNIQPMKGRDLKKFCEEEKYVPIFDIEDNDRAKIAENYQKKYNKGADAILAASRGDRPSDRCLMLIKAKDLLFMMENSSVNNPKR